jgi:hypothetical protein
VSGLRAGEPGFVSRQGQRSDFFLFVTALKPVLGPNQFPIQCVPGKEASIQLYLVKHRDNFTVYLPFVISEFV